ncbi:cytochrome c [Aquibium sp. A9E412]|uniref:c-type cytochrome n=1 Tax=Aquibium sp. A9E412 TaxID=2976767 RepID=UPI0025B235EA|nr:cytochrome c [Aquibium sp. A9E412]MDN2566115.1 cytochrome c [Aquibium sp. A9E412]
MPMPRKASRAVAFAALAGLAAPVAVMAQSDAPAPAGPAARTAPIGLGERPSEELLRAWNIDISPDGENLPQGSGSVSEGETIFAQSCAVCHGADGTGGPMDRLAGGKGTLDTDDPVKTVGSYWPYATTLYDYVHRAMPFDNPQSLTADEVYAVTAYVLHLNELVPQDAVMDAQSLPQVEMPNRDAFEQMDTVTLPEAEACMSDCQPFDVDMQAATPSEIEEEQVQ